MSMPQDCRDVLIQRNLSMLSSSRSERLILLQSFNQESFDTARHSTGASVPGLFSGTYNDFDQHVRNEMRLSKVQFSNDEAVSALTLTALNDAVPAWVKCMTDHRAGLFSWLEGESTGTLFTLHLQWAPSLGLGGKPLTGVLESIAGQGGGAKFTHDIPSVLKPGEFSCGIVRATPSVTVRGHINAIAGTDSVTTSFFIPPAIIHAPPYWLSDHPDDLIHDQDVHGELQFNRVYWQESVWIGGIKYEKAIGLHPPDNGRAYADFRIPSGARSFATIFGLARDDANPDSYGRVRGRIFVDGNLEWEATIATPVPQSTHLIGLPPGAKVLRLEVDSLGDNSSDNATWANPFFNME